MGSSFSFHGNTAKTLCNGVWREDNGILSCHNLDLCVYSLLATVGERVVILGCEKRMMQSVDGLQLVRIGKVVLVVCLEVTTMLML